MKFIPTEYLGNGHTCLQLLAWLNENYLLTGGLTTSNVRQDCGLQDKTTGSTGTSKY